MKKRKILILEDDKAYAETLEDFLNECGYETQLAYDANEALAKKYFNKYDLCLFDINIPYMNGIELFRSLKESGDDTPTIFITSYKDIRTLKECFKEGCDDYLKKPIDPDELLCRIEAVFSRNYQKSQKIFLNTACYFDTDTRRVYECGQDLNLQPKVIALLELFIKNQNRVITKDQIIEHLWSTSENFSNGSIRVYINRLKKIVAKERLINIKGVGYKFSSS